MENEIKIISDREQKEYLPLCPVQVQKNTITEENGSRTLQITLGACTDKTPLRCRLTLQFTDARRAPAGTEEVTVSLADNTPVPAPDTAVYVVSRVEQVW